MYTLLELKNYVHTYLSIDLIEKLLLKRLFILWVFNVLTIEKLLFIGCLRWVDKKVCFTLFCSFISFKSLFSDFLR